MKVACLTPGTADVVDVALRELHHERDLVARRDAILRAYSCPTFHAESTVRMMMNVSSANAAPGRSRSFGTGCVEGSSPR